jgi:uncharacterized delta-60 repeat protein
MGNVMSAALPISRCIGLCVLCLAASIWGRHAAGAAGQLDPTFAFGGQLRVVVDSSASSKNVHPNGIAVQPDGGLVVAVDGSGSFLVRLGPLGARDGRFGVNGRVVTIDAPRAVLVQPDGKIVVAGGRTTLQIARYKPDGTPDPGFGVSGIVTETFATILSGSAAGAADIVMQPDGKLVVVGSADRSIALLRLNPNGTLDPSFGSGGKVLTSHPSGDAFGTAIALSADGRLAVAGYVVALNNGAGWVTARYNNDGSLDASFGGGGLVTGPLGANSQTARHIIVQGDGRLVVAGNGGGRAAVVRYNVNGTLDASFGTDGVVSLVVADDTGASALALQPDGKLLVGITPISQRMSAVRLLSSGAIDASYAAPALLTVGDGTTLFSAVLQPDGKLVLGGSLAIASDERVDLAFARLQGDEITGTVVEYHNDILDHYFVTANSVEQASIEAGGSGPGWTRTGLDFKSGGNSRVCRFYGTPGIGPNSHTYTINALECEQVKLDPGWHFEGYDFSASPPVEVCRVADCEFSGWTMECTAGSVPVYRAYNDRFRFNDSNHRLTTSLAAYDAMIAAGWRGESIVMCVPE